MGDPDVQKVVVVLDGKELTTIASEMARAYARMVAYYRTEYGLSTEEADGKTRELIEGAKDDDWVLTAPPDQVSWWRLGEMEQHDPEGMILAWERIKQEARFELESGHRAATGVLATGGSPWERARFLVIREAFRKEWQPSDGIEAALVDVLAQAHCMYLFWIERLMSRATFDAQHEDGDVRRTGRWRLPQVMAVDAENQAAAMMDRFNRLFMRTLRGLRDLRRYAPKVMIQNAGQVNIGEQQVNIADQRVGDDTQREPTCSEPQSGPPDQGEQ